MSKMDWAPGPEISGLGYHADSIPVIPAYYAAGPVLSQQHEAMGVKQESGIEVPYQITNYAMQSTEAGDIQEHAVNGPGTGNWYQQWHSSSPVLAPPGMFAGNDSLPQQPWSCPTGSVSMASHGNPESGPHPFSHSWNSVNGTFPHGPVENGQPPVVDADPSLQRSPIVITPRDEVEMSSYTAQANMTIKGEPQNSITSCVETSTFTINSDLAPPTSVGTAVSVVGPAPSSSHPCSVCGLLFSQVGELESHMLSHNTVRNPDSNVSSAQRRPNAGPAGPTLARRWPNDGSPVLLSEKADISIGQGKSEQDTFSQAAEFSDVHLQSRHSTDYHPPPECSNAEWDQLRDICDIVPIQRNTIGQSGCKYKYVCKFCATSAYRKEQMIKHGDLRKTGKFKCRRCMLPFCTWQTMRYHTYKQCTEASLDEANVYRCSKCSKTYGTRYGLLRHEKQSKCKDEPRNKRDVEGVGSASGNTDLDRVSITSGSNSAKAPHVCSVCSKLFSTADALENHMKFFQDGDGFMCIRCHITFTSTQALTRHIEAHNKTSAYQCPACNKTYTRKQRLKEHFKDSKCSRAGNSATCAHCREVYLPKDAYWAHLKCDREGKHCVECGITLSSEKTLNVANQCHKCQKKIHVCSDCGRIFDGQSDLHLHRKGDETYTSIFVLGKDRLDNSADAEVSLVNNAAVPEPVDISQMATVHHCLVCDIIFDKYEAYLKHRSTCKVQYNHNIPKTTRAGFPKAKEPGLRPRHQCLLCHRTFISAYGLQKHKLHLNFHKCTLRTQRRNGKSRPMAKFRFDVQYYECPVCREMFLYPSEIEEHIRSVSDRTKRHCSLCHLRIFCSGMLKYHTHNHLAMRRDYKCSVCCIGFYQHVRYQEHVTLSKCALSRQEVVCQLCGIAYTPYSSIQDHVSCGSVNGTYPCRSCGEVYNTRINLLRHKAYCVGIGKSDTDTQALVGIFQKPVMPMVPRAIILTKSHKDSEHSLSSFTATDSREGMVENHFSMDISMSDNTTDNTNNRNLEANVGPTSGRQERRWPDIGAKTIAIWDNTTADKPAYMTERAFDTKMQPQVIILHALSIYENMPRRVYRCTDCNRLFKSVHYLYQHRVSDKHCTVKRSGLKGELLLSKSWGIHLNGMPAKETDGPVKKGIKSASTKRRWTPRPFPAPRAPSHICDVCRKRFRHKQSLSAHQRLFEVERELSCTSCHQTFADNLSYKRHMENIHKSGGFECPVCHCTVEFKEKLSAHMEKKCGVSEQSILCTGCGENYVPRDNYIVHLRCMNIRLHTCKLCNAVFPLMKQLLEHKDICDERMKKKEGEFVVTMDGGSEEAVGILKSTDGIGTDMATKESDEAVAKNVNNTVQKCPVCERSHTNKSRLQRHLGSVHVVEPSVQCPKCASILPNRRSFGAHMGRKHRSYKSVDCKKCRKAFTSQEQLKDHLANHPRKAHFCIICGKQYFILSHLTQHYKTHPGYQGIECSKCHATFTKLIDYKYHLISHKGDTGFLCSRCGIMLQSRSLLQDHIALKHIKEKNHKCEFCSKKFVLAKTLKRHMQLHTGGKRHACSMCPKRFEAKSKLTVHFRKHTGEMPFGCEICGKRFHTKFTYNQHLRVHAEKKYVCDECGSRFSEPGYLVRHMKQRHPESLSQSREIP